MSRGDRRENIFEDADDRYTFLKTLGQACEKTGWQVHAYCLMDNHFHLVIETPQPNLVAGMKWLLGTYTGRYNRRHRLGGHLFSGRYKALVVDGSESGYLRTVCDYVHLNPIRAKLLPPEQKLREYRWSSVADYIRQPAQRVRWLRVDRLFGKLGIPKDSVAGRRRFEQSTMIPQPAALPRAKLSPASRQGSSAVISALKFWSPSTAVSAMLATVCMTASEYSPSLKMAC